MVKSLTASSLVAGGRYIGVDTLGMIRSDTKGISVGGARADSGTIALLKSNGDIAVTFGGVVKSDIGVDGLLKTEAGVEAVEDVSEEAIGERAVEDNGEGAIEVAGDGATEDEGETILPIVWAKAVTSSGGVTISVG